MTSGLGERLLGSGLLPAMGVGLLLLLTTCRKPLRPPSCMLLLLPLPLLLLLLLLVLVEVVLLPGGASPEGIGDPVKAGLV